MDAMLVVGVPLLVLLVLMGGLLAATPWLMRKRECFAVTVPEAAQSDPAVVRLKHRYAALMGGATVVCAAVGGGLLIASRLEAAAVVMTVGMLALSVLSVALMLYARGRVRALKAERGWHAADDVRSAVVAEGDMPRAVSPAWELLNLPVIALTLALGVLGYSSMPDLVPVHMGFDGQVNDWAEKSPQVVAFVPLVQVFLVACLAFSQWSILRSKKAVTPDAPVSSAYAYGLFARAQSIFLVALGLLLNGSLVVMQLSMVGAVSMAFAAGVVMVVALLGVAGAVAIAVIYGQSGARLMARVQDGAGLPSDDDRFWKMGLIYVNHDDPSLFVPARFGIGWTCNFGRPATWVILTVFVLVCAAFVVGVSLLL